jgi:hypothetical protein
MERNDAPGREVLDDGDREQDHDRYDEQARRPSTWHIVPTLNQQLIHNPHRPSLAASD